MRALLLAVIVLAFAPGHAVSEDVVLTKDQLVEKYMAIKQAKEQLLVLKNEVAAGLQPYRAKLGEVNY